MPTIVLPADGTPNWGPPIRAAITTINDAVDDLIAEAAPRVYVQSSAPTFASVGIWVETNAGGDPDAIRLYYEDGTP